MNKDITLEDLDFIKGEDNKHFLVYKKTFEKSIVFKKIIKHVELDGNFTLQELQAIYNKCKELGWLDG